MLGKMIINKVETLERYYIHVECGNSFSNIYINTDGEIGPARAVSSSSGYGHYYFPSEAAAQAMIDAKREEVDAYIATKLITGEW